MSLLFSRRCEYALQAVLFVAKRSGNELTSIKQLSTALGIPHHFLAKILQDLSQKRLLVSHKGPGGGFALGMPAEDITLFHIVEAIDGLHLTQHCILGFQDCSDKYPCALHERWLQLRGGVIRMLVSKNVHELAKEMKRPPFRLSAGRPSRQPRSGSGTRGEVQKSLRAPRRVGPRI
jgi:Rrf2 family protein